MGAGFTSVVEIELAAGVWTDVTPDVFDGIAVGYGIQGGGPNDRCASTGTMRLSLNNSASNSGAKSGYYSPGHANCRAGFDLGVRVRWRVTTALVDDGAFVSTAFDASSFSCGATARTFFLGTLTRATPTPGTYAEKRTHLEVVDWIDIAASVTTNADLQLGKRSDEIVTAILAGLGTQPETNVLGTGNSTFTYAMDNAKDESTRVLAALSSLAQSEGGFIYVRGGGTFVFENRLLRCALSPEFVIDDTMHELEVDYSREDLYNSVAVSIHPRRIDAAATTVLYSLGTAPSVDSGQTIRPFGGFGDPLNANRRCGGTAMVTPVASTDFTMNTAQNGSGSDVTGQFTVVASFTANGVSWEITNNGTATAYVTKLQCRGKGLYDSETTQLRASDAASITAYGERLVQVDMPYQDDAYVGDGFAQFLLNLYKTSVMRPRSVGFFALDSLLTYALTYDIGTRFSLVEAQTGVDTEMFIQSVQFVDENGLLKVKWGLAPADMNSYWLLGTANASELGLTTRLGFA